MPRERWLTKRKNEILSTDYYHVVFTLPHELNPVVLNNKKAMQLSVNFLVVMILSIAILAGSLVLVRTLFSKAENLKLELDESTEREIPCRTFFVFR